MRVRPRGFRIPVGFTGSAGLRQVLITSLIALFQLQNLAALEMLTQSKPHQFGPIQLGPICGPVAGQPKLRIDPDSNDLHWTQSSGLSPFSLTFI